jgi:hypothetical protein
MYCQTYTVITSQHPPLQLVPAETHTGRPAYFLNLPEGGRATGPMYFVFCRLYLFSTIPSKVVLYAPVAEFTDPGWRDKVNPDIGLSYLPAGLHGLAGRYDNPMPGSTLSPSQGSLNSATAERADTHPLFLLYPYTSKYSVAS